MKQARTIVNHLREELWKQPPFSNLYLTVAAWEEESSCWGFYYSSYRYSPEDMAAILFDKSISGYYVSTVDTASDDINYYVRIWLKLSERRKTNIDASVVQEVVNIAEKTSKPH